MSCFPDYKNVACITTMLPAESDHEMSVLLAILLLHLVVVSLKRSATDHHSKVDSFDRLPGTHKRQGSVAIITHTGTIREAHVHNTALGKAHSASDPTPPLLSQPDFTSHQIIKKPSLTAVMHNNREARRGGCGNTWLILSQTNSEVANVQERVYYLLNTHTTREQEGKMMF